MKACCGRYDDVTTTLRGHLHDLSQDVVRTHGRRSWPEICCRLEKCNKKSTTLGNIQLHYYITRFKPERCGISEISKYKILYLFYISPFIMHF